MNRHTHHQQPEEPTDVAHEAEHGRGDSQPARSDSHGLHASGDGREGHDEHEGHRGHEGHDRHEGRGSHEDHSGHGSHEGHDHSSHAEQYRRLFWIMLALGVPVVLASPMFASLVGYEVPDGLTWIAPVLGTVMYVWGGRPFLVAAIDEIRARHPGMMLLVGLAITVAFLASAAATLGLLHHDLEFWWEMALLIVIMLLGHWLEMKSLAQTSSALDSLAALLPDETEKVVGDEITTVAPANLEVGDVVIVRPGGRVPADGTIIDGAASMDESMITGESAAVPRTVGEQVVAGTVATDSGIRVEISAVGDDTALAGIQRLVADAQSSSTRAQRLADRAAALLFWYALAAAGLTIAVWLIIGDPQDAVARTITVLVIACPHALGLAIPLVVSIATEKAARGGVLIADRLALESMRTVDTVIFDKTGTLTKGSPTVDGIRSVDGFADDEVLALAAAAESSSEHPLARAIVSEAQGRNLAIPASDNFSSSPAVGVRADVQTDSGSLTVLVGGPFMLEQEGAESIADEWSRSGATVLHVVVDGGVVGALRVADEIRPESKAAVTALHRRGIDVIMITGDAEAVAASVAEELGIDGYFASVRPEDKAGHVKRLQGEGRQVAMVGDGINDAPALAQADVGIAIGAGTDVAIASAGVILASDDPRSVLSVVELSTASYRKMKQNLWWAAGYNLAAVPLAAGVLAPWGFIMPMSVGAILMSLSTVIVALNAQQLRSVDLSPERTAPLEGAGREAVQM